ncbi:MAG: hypothetical protein ACOCX3_00980 [Chloroflexota bacterium]
MIERPEPAPQAQPESRPTGTVSREQLERGLRRALAAGPSALVQQIRYILALCQLGARKPSPSAETELPLTISEARLTALVALAETLSSERRERLMTEIQKLGEDDVRVCLSLELLPHTPEAVTPKRLVTLREEAGHLSNAAARARALLALARLVPLMPQDEQVLPEGINAALTLSRSFNSAEARVRVLVALAPYLPEQTTVRAFNEVLDAADESASANLHANIISAMTSQLPEACIERAVQSTQRIEEPADRARAFTALMRIIADRMRNNVQHYTLRAIADIRAEDDRCSALIAFGPYLEAASEEMGFPEVLEEALAIAISMTRRAVRARALVALAPYLTIDLQSEALSAVNELSSERDRATLLADLASTLPPNMLVASLAIAHTMREQDARVHALTVLARYVPSQARSQTMLDALAAASNLPRPYERVTALMALVDTLPESLQEQAFTNALETTRLIENENARARALSLLGAHLPSTLINRAVEVARQIEDNEQRLNALLGLVTRLEGDAHEQIVDRMLDSLQHIPFEYKRARALISVAPHLTNSQRLRAQSSADTLEDPYDRASAYVALAQHANELQRKPLIEKSLRLIDKIDDGYDRSSALAAIAPLLPASEQRDLAETIHQVIAMIDDEYDKASAVNLLADTMRHSPPVRVQQTVDLHTILRDALDASLRVEHQTTRARLVRQASTCWTILDINDRYRLWVRVALGLATLPLADTLLIVGELFPVLEEIGAPGTAEHIAHILGVR